MVCNVRMEILYPPITTIFGILIAFVAAFAFAGNFLIIFIIIKMKNRTRSIVILSSLALSDFLVGTIIGLIASWQLLSRAALKNCVADNIRGYFVILLVGSSVLTLAIVSYDRYLLLTKLNNYKIFMTKQKTAILIFLSWFLPGLIPILRQVHAYVYLITVFVLFTAPLIVLVICYFFITRAVRQKEIEMKKHNPTNITNEQISRFSSSEHTENNNTMEVRRKKQMKHIQLAKAVMLLITCYIICILPINLWITMDLSKFDYGKENHQKFYLLGTFFLQCNSCINPMIYFSKNPEFKRGLKKIFNIKSSSTHAELA